VGGPLPSCYPDLILCDIIDFLVRGEGEKSFVHLIEHISTPQTVPNVVWKKNGRIIKNPVTMIKDIDSIPFPDRENFIFDTYMEVWQKHFQFTCTSVLSSRGCPYQCSFCDKSVFGYTYRARSVENIIPEIVYLDERGVEKIWFADDLFTLDKKRVLALCDEMKKEGLALEWYCESRVDTIDKEMLQTMKRAGCTWIGFGVESGNADILTYMRKGHTIQTVEKAFTITKEVGINRCAYFILGLPRDTPETVKDTLQFAMKIDPDSVEFSLPIPIPGTTLWEEVQTVHESFDFFDNRSFLVFDHPHFSKNAAETMIQDAYTQFLQFKRKTNPDFTLEDQW
jgi:anaerobic magnesium-protoporphyrin IX monomethyl ester cyclase